MSYELEIIPDTRIALFCWTGPITLEDREENRHCVMQFCQENSLDQLIIDTRQEINKTRTMQMFDFAAAIPKRMRGLHIAVIRNADDVEIQFGEAVAVNRGATLRAFLTLEDAQRWLEAETVRPINSDPGDS